MKTILLVEDDIAIAKACVQILSEAGYAVNAVSNGDTAVEYLEQKPPVDLLIVDMFIPGKDGYEVIDASRRLQPSLPIIGISGGGDVTDPHSLLNGARELGALVTLAKPFSGHELLQVVDQVFHRAQKTKERWSVFDLLRRSRSK